MTDPRHAPRRLVESSLYRGGSRKAQERPQASNGGCGNRSGHYLKELATVAANRLTDVRRRTSHPQAFNRTPVLYCRVAVWANMESALTDVGSWVTPRQPLRLSEHFAFKGLL